MEPWRLDPAQTALLLIDAQERLLPAMHDADALTRRLADAVRLAKLLGLRVFHTEQAPAKLGPTAAPARAALGDDAPAPRAKDAFSAAGCFAPGELPPTLLVAGVETHVCVRQTVLDLHARGHAAVLLADCVGSRSPRDHRPALHELRARAAARVTTLETVAWELLGGADDPRFKAVLAILK